MTAHQPRRIGPGAARARLGCRAAMAAGASAVLAGSILLGMGGTVMAAPPNALSNAAVTPAGGTTNTTFAFAVTFQSAQGNDPTGVTAIAGNVVVPLTLVSGSASSGRYRGTAKLPAGTWDVTFQAASKGNDPSLAGPTLTVKPAPAPTATPRPTATLRPTPRPTPHPTPRATPRATAPTRQPTSSPQVAGPSTAPRTPHPRRDEPSRRPHATPGATPTARATRLGGGGVQTATPSATPANAASRGPAGPSGLVTVLTGSLVAVGLLALVAMSIVLAVGRRRRRDTRLELLPEEALQAAPASSKVTEPEPRAPAPWERDWALDGAPIGSVEYRPPPGPPTSDEENA